MTGTSSPLSVSRRDSRALMFGGLFVLMFLAAVRGYAVLAAAPNLGGQRWRQAQADNVRMAVFRWQIAQHRKFREVCFLTVQGKLARNAAFVSQFRGGAFVKPLAEAQIGKPGSPMLLNTPRINGYVDAQTGKPALHFWVDGLTWQSDARVEVAGGGATAMGSGDDGTFTVIWRGNRWVVTGYKMSGIF